MEYRDHPLLEGFKNESDDMLRFAIVSQIDLATYIKNGDGMVPEVKAVLEEKLKSIARPGLEKFLYHAIVVAVKTNKEARSGGK
jgi:hypothetical protein